MRKTKNLVKIVYLISALILIICLSFLILDLFKVKKIYTSASTSEMREFPFLGERYLFLINEEDLKRHFFKFPRIKSVIIQKIYPNSINIKIVYRERLAQVISESNVYFLDNEGVVFEKTAAVSVLPVMNLLIKDINLGTNIAQNGLKSALIILELAKINYIEITNLSQIDNQNIQFTLKEGTQVFIDSNANPEDIVSSLQMILKRFTIEGKSVSKIDFRFDKPVINY